MAVYNCHGCKRNADHTLVAYLAVAVTLQLKARVCLIEYLKLNRQSWSRQDGSNSPRRRSEDSSLLTDVTIHISRGEHQKWRWECCPLMGPLAWLSYTEDMKNPRNTLSRRQQGEPTSQKDRSWCSTWKLPSVAHESVCNMCVKDEKYRL